MSGMMANNSDPPTSSANGASQAQHQNQQNDHGSDSGQQAWNAIPPVTSVASSPGNRRARPPNISIPGRHQEEARTPTKRPRDEDHTGSARLPAKRRLLDSAQPSPSPAPSAPASRPGRTGPAYITGSEATHPFYRANPHLRPQSLPTPGTAAFSNLSLRSPLLISGQPLPPPPKPKPPFRLLDRLMRHPEIILRLSSLMHPTSLLTLYTISRPFHFIVNSHFTTYIRSSARIHAPDSDHIFPWRCYAALCIKDPAMRLRKDSKPTEWRDVPGFKWLLMVSTRHAIVAEIVDVLASRAFVLTGVSYAHVIRCIKKIAFMLDLPTNGNRIGLVHNSVYFADRDLLCMTSFFLKLDMALTDPVEGNGESSLRRLVLGQRSLMLLLRVLHGTYYSQLDLLRLWVAYDYTPTHAGLPVFGIPADRIGRGCLEHWGTIASANQRLMRPDELVLRETIRRSMGTHLLYVDLLRSGHASLSMARMKKDRREWARIGERAEGEGWAQAALYGWMEKDLEWMRSVRVAEEQRRLWEEQEERRRQWEEQQRQMEEYQEDEYEYEEEEEEEEGEEQYDEEEEEEPRCGACSGCRGSPSESEGEYEENDDEMEIDAE